MTDVLNYFRQMMEISQRKKQIDSTWYAYTKTWNIEASNKLSVFCLWHCNNGIP